MDSPLSLGDPAVVMQGAPDGICYPTLLCGGYFIKLADYLSALETREGLPLGSTKIICVATETADALLRFESYLEGVSERLVAMTWGAEDLGGSAPGVTENRFPGRNSTTHRSCWPVR